VKVEERLRQLEGKSSGKHNSAAKGKSKLQLAQRRMLSLVLLIGSAEAFQAPVLPARPAVARSTAIQANINYDAAMDKWKAENPWMAKYGFGPSVKAERWNGRHAMFGWLAIIATGYAKGHGFFPSGDTALTYANWGGLAQIGFGQYISNERAIIMIAHIHALAISAAAAFGPQVLGDSLTLLDGEADEEPYGFIPPIKQTGLTPAAEMMNGRMAMVGLIAVVATSVASGQDILDVVNTGVGGLLF